MVVGGRAAIKDIDVKVVGVSATLMDKRAMVVGTCATVAGMDAMVVDKRAMVAGLMVTIVGLIAIIAGRRATPGYQRATVGCVPVALTLITCLEIISICHR